MTVLVVAGARPNFMKVAPILRALDRRGVRTVLVHTGQHYDAQMSDAFFRDLALRVPDHHLGVGSGGHAEQTARVMVAFEPVLIATRPDWVLVVGDVNSTLACALVTAKLRPELGCRLAHVEAGLRSGDWSMPEEVNRVLTDRLADLLLLPSEDARENLLTEGIQSSRIVFAGNVMIDSLRSQLDRAREADVPRRFGLTEGAYVVCTLHRPSNVDAPDTLRAILKGLAMVATELPVVLPMHPRTRSRSIAFGFGELLEHLKVTEPLGYREMLGLVAASAAVLTDSGGLQEETTYLGVPCVTLRAQTERPVTIALGTNQLAPWPLSPDGILDAFRLALARRSTVATTCAIAGWDGEAAERIAQALITAGAVPAGAR
jgi:UDP-N-acetylglucosamine 2-epimerase (non-hydrolysing)